MRITPSELATLRANPDIEGVFDRGGLLYLDKRLTMEAIGRLGLSLRSADLNIIGPDVVELEIVEESILDTDRGEV